MTPQGVLDFRPLEPALRFSILALHLEDRPLSVLAKRFLDTLQPVLDEAFKS